MEKQLVSALTQLSEAVATHAKEDSLTSALMLGMAQGRAEFVLREAAERQTHA